MSIPSIREIWDWRHGEKSIESTMGERIGQARSGEVKRVLVTLRDFVLDKAEEAKRGDSCGRRQG